MELSDSDSDMEVVEAKTVRPLQRPQSPPTSILRNPSNPNGRPGTLKCCDRKQEDWTALANPESNQCVNIRAVQRTNGTAYWGDLAAGACYITIDMVRKPRLPFEMALTTTTHMD